MTSIRNQTEYADENNIWRADGWDYYDYLTDEKEGGWKERVGIELDNDVFIPLIDVEKWEEKMRKFLDTTWDNLYEEIIVDELDSIEDKLIDNDLVQHISADNKEDMIKDIVYGDCKQYFLNMFNALKMEEM